MILKPRAAPVELLKLEALSIRTYDHHPGKDQVLSEVAMKKAGYQGEVSLSYPLSLLSSKDLFIIHDVRLFDGISYFQIDTLIITTKFILIIEAKNISGVLYFDTKFNQLIRKNEFGEESFPDPILQVKRHKLQLRNWLVHYQLTHLPIETIVVISNPRTIIKSSSENIRHKVIPAAQLPFHLINLQQKHTRKYLQDQDALDISNQIIERNTPRNIDVLRKYGIKSEELIRGIRCPQCSNFKCKRTFGNWTCSRCGAESKDAHVAALRDYALLIGTEAANNQIRDFLLLESRSVARKLLLKMNLPSSGERRWKKYSLTSLIGEDYGNGS
ncbi:NERD domain-containing protein [Bacillus salacetis]|uniref:NERD domain-containing protein n=1 Tax=Bacillus salacetis TaxID=2315464 RepID=UPI003B9FC212